MRITDFERFIREIPYKYQSFDIKREFWGNKSQSLLIDNIFGGKDQITLSRFDLFNSTYYLDTFVIKVLMWGYPTKGRGNNIDNLLLPENFRQLLNILEKINQYGSITIYEIQDLLKIKGLGFSTLSKILYFKKIKVESLSTALILDMRVINSLCGDRFNDHGIEKFKGLNYSNAPFRYADYLHFIHLLADQMKAKADQVEMFLFEFGTNLKEPIGEEGHFDDL